MTWDEPVDLDMPLNEALSRADWLIEQGIDGDDPVYDRAVVVLAREVWRLQHDQKQIRQMLTALTATLDSALG